MVVCVRACARFVVQLVWIGFAWIRFGVSNPVGIWWTGPAIKITAGPRYGRLNTVGAYRTTVERVSFESSALL